MRRESVTNPPLAKVIHAVARAAAGDWSENRLFPGDGRRHRARRSSMIRLALGGVSLRILVLGFDKTPHGFGRNVRRRPLHFIHP